MVEVVAEALEPLVGWHADLHVEITCRCAPLAGATLPDKPKSRAIVNPGRNVNRERPALVHPAGTKAHGARRLDPLAGPITGRAC